MKLSVIIITKNEEKMIADCLDSLTFCDEVIVVDGESEDRTIEIAKKMGALVYTRPFTDFATARNFGFTKARGDWVLYVDADERVGKDLRAGIQQELAKDDKTIGAYVLKRRNYYLGDHEWPYVEKMERVFRKERFQGWYGKLHESPRFEGEKAYLEGFLLHYTHRDLGSMLEKTIIWSTAEAKLRFDAAHPHVSWWRFPRVMITSFLHSYIGEKGYKAGTAGIVESMYQAFSMFVTYAKLWEMQKEKKR